MSSVHRVILVDTVEETCQILGSRLRMQGYDVEIAADPARGAYLALSNPPSVVVADLWMPSISGVQLCRLLGSEPATENVPVILRGPQEHRDRFWAERAGAFAYVGKGRMGDLVRAIARAIHTRGEAVDDNFFTQLGADEVDIRDRIAEHLDRALFDSVLASEVRALSTCGEFERLFDLFTQLLTQLTRYRWVAISTTNPRRFAVHTPPTRRVEFEAEARNVLDVATELPAMRVEDEDAYPDDQGARPLVHDIKFGPETIARIAVSCCTSMPLSDHSTIEVVARELGGPIRIASLVEESQRLARVDSLTHLLNRRAFLSALEQECARCDRHGWHLSMLLLDVDHFKSINDRHGHGTGDRVLAALGGLLREESRKVDIPARWGGEEFVIALTGTELDGALIAAERIRSAIARLQVGDEDGVKVPVTGSIGVTAFVRHDTVGTLIDRADRAMYTAKSSGRNRVCSVTAEGVATVAELTRPDVLAS